MEPPRALHPTRPLSAGREARWNATFINIWENAEHDKRQIANARRYSKSLAPWEIGGGYLN
ncbi:hypothetical protein BH18ACT12_BH18ACT12_05910 [soil metagenome]